MEIYSLFKKVYYYDNKYHNIIVIDRKPKGNITQISKLLNMNKLSSFRTYASELNNCMYAILNPNNKNELLNITDISILFTWLVNNGYTINTTFSDKILNLNNNIICFISKNN
jgi:hypothetical protein